MRRRRRVLKEEHSLLLKAAKILVRLGASVNLTLATGGERYGHFRCGARARADSKRTKNIGAKILWPVLDLLRSLLVSSGTL